MRDESIPHRRFEVPGGPGAPASLSHGFACPLKPEGHNLRVYYGADSEAQRERFLAVCINSDLRILNPEAETIAVQAAHRREIRADERAQRLAIAGANQYPYAE